MKKYILLLICLPLFANAQIPAGYYNAAAGQTGEALYIALRNIIRTHTELTYTPGLWNAYHTTDVKPNGRLWDMYSDIPGGTPAYEYTLGVDQCGSSTPSAEGGCYNREHTWPQSKFNEDPPMKSDLFLVYPTDNYVNATRGDLQYGKVGTATKTFTNGSKIGNNVYPGASGSCYEPVDSFKGDLARTYFYISTCYRNDSSHFVTWEMATQVRLKPWAAAMLLEWHHNDPVSKKELDRNNAAYALQANRNPFIDHPEYADCIWGTTSCAVGVATYHSEPHIISLFPNPATSQLNISWQGADAPRAIRVTDVSGRVMASYNIEAHNNGLQIAVTGWPHGVYFVQAISGAAVTTQRFVVE